MAITHFVLAEHLRSYTHTWAAVALLALVGLLIALSTPETLHRSSAGSTKEGLLNGSTPPSPHASGAALLEGAPSDAAVGGADWEAEEEEEARRLHGDNHNLSSADASPIPYGGPPSPANDAPAKNGGGAEGVRVCSPLRLLTWLCGGASRKGSSDGGGGLTGLWGRGVDSLHTLCAPCALAPLRFIMLLEGPSLIALAAYSTLDGFALIAYSWEQETMYYARLLALPAAGVRPRANPGSNSRHLGLSSACGL